MTVSYVIFHSNDAFNRYIADTHLSKSLPKTLSSTILYISFLPETDRNNLVAMRKPDLSYPLEDTTGTDYGFIYKVFTVT